MALTINVQAASGKTLYGTLVRRSDGYKWNNSAQAWQSAPSYANQKITLTEGSSDTLGLYSGSNAGSLGDAGQVGVLVHDSALADQTVGLPVDVYVVGGSEVQVYRDSSGRTDVGKVGGTAQTAGNIYGLLADGDVGLAKLGENQVTMMNGQSTLQDAIDDALLAITNLNNLSALVNLYGSPLLEIPDSSTTQFAFTMVVRDNEGKLVDLDSSPTIAAANAAGTSRTANLSAVSHPATGRYTFTYGVASDAVEESLRITCSGAVSSEGRYIEWIGAVVDYDTLTTLNAINTKIGTPAVTLADDIAAGTAYATTAATQSTSANSKATTIQNTLDDGTNGLAAIKAGTQAGKLASDGLDTALASTLDLNSPAGSKGEALVAARAQGAGKWVLDKTAKTLKLYAPNGSTLLYTFNLDSGTAPTSRTPV